MRTVWGLYVAHVNFSSPTEPSHLFFVRCDTPWFLPSNQVWCHLILKPFYHMETLVFRLSSWCPVFCIQNTCVILLCLHTGAFSWAAAPVTVQISEQGSGYYPNRLHVQLHILFARYFCIRQIPSVWDQCICYIILEQASYILKKT